MKQHFVKQVAIIVAGLVMAAPVAFAQTCHYSEIDPGKGAVSAGELSIDLGQGDGSDNPTAWLGPVTVTHASGEACSVDPNVSIVERPLYSDGKHLIVSAYSGSEQNVYAIDAATCKVLWKSESFSGRVKLTGNRLQLGKHGVKLGGDCAPVR